MEDHMAYGSPSRRAASGREDAPPDMGTLAEARVALIRRAREWRDLRLPVMGSQKALRALDLREREARFQLANAAVLWLWHMEREGLAWDGGEAVQHRVSDDATRSNAERRDEKDLPSTEGEGT